MLGLFSLGSFLGWAKSFFRAGTGLTLTSAPQSLTFALSTPVSAANGGTGSTSVPSSGQVPVGNGGGTAYAPQTISGSGATFTLSSAGLLTISGITVGAGGTGAGTFTAHGVLLGNAASAFNVTAVGATNTVLHGNTGADPTYSAVVEGDISLSDVTTDNASTSAHGFRAKLTNVGGSFQDETGTVQVGGYILGSSGTATGTTSSASETNLANIKIPAGIMGTNGSVEIAVLYKFTGTTNTKTPTVRHTTASGSTSGGTVLFTAAATSTNLSYQILIRVWNSNSASAQVAQPNSQVGPLGGSTITPNTGAINTANDSWINLNGATTSGSDTCGVVGYTVKFIPGK